MTEEMAKEEGKKEVIEPETEPFFEEEIRTEAENLYKQYSEKFKLSEETRKDIGDFLGKEKEKELLEFSKDWWKNNEADLKGKKGGWQEDATDEYIYTTAMEKGALVELFTRPYQERREEIENVMAIGKEIEKGEALTIDDQLLLLDRLRGREREAEAQLQELKSEKGREFEEKLVSEELSKIQKMEEELVGKMFGEDIRKEVEELKGPEKRKKLEELGYVIKEKGIVRKKYEVVKPEEDIEGKITKKGKIIAEGEEEVIGKAKGTEEIDKLTEDLLVRKEVEKQLGKIPEMKEEIIKEKYRVLKEKIAKEAIEKKVRDKSPEEMKIINEKLAGKGKSIEEFVDAATKKEGELFKLTGDLEKDAPNLIKLLERFGVEGVTPKDLEAFDKEKASAEGKKWKTWKEVAGKVMALLEWFLFFLVYFVKEAAEAKKKI